MSLWLQYWETPSWRIVRQATALTGRVVGLWGVGDNTHKLRDSSWRIMRQATALTGGVVGLWGVGDNTHKLIARDFDALVSVLRDSYEKILHCGLYNSKAPAPMLTESANITTVCSAVKIRRQFRNYEAHREYSDRYQSSVLLDS